MCCRSSATVICTKQPRFSPSQVRELKEAKVFGAQQADAVRRAQSTVDKLQGEAREQQGHAEPQSAGWTGGGGPQSLEARLTKVCLSV